MNSHLSLWNLLTSGMATVIVMTAGIAKEQPISGISGVPKKRQENCRRHWCVKAVYACRGLLLRRTGRGAESEPTGQKKRHSGQAMTLTQKDWRRAVVFFGNSRAYCGLKRRLEAD